MGIMVVAYLFSIAPNKYFISLGIKVKIIPLCYLKSFLNTAV